MPPEGLSLVTLPDMEDKHDRFVCVCVCVCQPQRFTPSDNLVAATTQASLAWFIAALPAC